MYQGVCGVAINAVLEIINCVALLVIRHPGLPTFSWLCCSFACNERSFKGKFKGFSYNRQQNVFVNS